MSEQTAARLAAIRGQLPDRVLKRADEMSADEAVEWLDCFIDGYRSSIQAAVVKAMLALHRVQQQDADCACGGANDHCAGQCSGLLDQLRQQVQQQDAALTAKDLRIACAEEALHEIAAATGFVSIPHTFNGDRIVAHVRQIVSTLTAITGLVEQWRRMAHFSFTTADRCVGAEADRTVADVLRQGADVGIRCADELSSLLAAQGAERTRATRSPR